MTTLQERLRDSCETGAIPDDIYEAADELDRLSAENAALLQERDAAFAMSRCECESDEACANLARMAQERDALAAQLQQLRDFVSPAGESTASIIYRIKGIIGEPDCDPAAILAVRDARVRVEERERCAKLCEARVETGAHIRCAAAIRAMAD